MNDPMREITEYQDISEAFHISMFRLHNAPLVHPRGHATKEISPYSFFVNDPSRLFVFNPFRHVNPFAQIAETLWVLAGRNDLDWLERYVPSCKKWSDDGKTWRAGYGPRLRRWTSDDPYWTPPVDQVRNVLELLSRDSDTRQAIISLWDPGRDWAVSKDIPCNNWLQFMVRDGYLNLHAVVRSNDAVFGFSHVDFFQWAVLKQMIEFWNGYDPGYIYWTAGSFHIYERHFAMAQANYMVDYNDSYYTKYDLIPFVRTFHTSHATLDLEFAKFFKFVDWLWDVPHDFDGECNVSISDALAQLNITDPFFLHCCFAMVVHRWNAHPIGKKYAMDFLDRYIDKDFDLYHAIVQYFFGERFAIGHGSLMDEEYADRYYAELNGAVRRFSPK